MSSISLGAERGPSPGLPPNGGSQVDVVAICARQIVELPTWPSASRGYHLPGIGVALDVEMRSPRARL